MSKLIGPDHNGESGQIAGKVFYRQFGQQLARKVPSPTSAPPTENQKDQRYGRFRPAFKFSQQMKYAAKNIFEVQPQTRTAFSEMTKQIFPAFTGTYEATVVDLSRVTLGNGRLPIVMLKTCTELVPGTVIISWTDELSTPDETADDLVTVMLSDDDGLRSSFIATGVKRSVMTATFARPQWSLGFDCHVSSLFIIGVDGVFKSPFQAADPFGALPMDT